MRVYVKAKENDKPKIKFGYQELAEKMWFKEKNGNEIEISHIGNDESLQKEFHLSLDNVKGLNDPRWRKIWNNSLRRQLINLSYKKKKNLFIVVSDNIKILTVDERALYIMVVEFAKTFESEISEDLCKTWISLKEFEDRHKKILSLTYDEENEISLKEAEILETAEEPFETAEEPYDWEDLIKINSESEVLINKNDIDKIMSEFLSVIKDQMDHALKLIAQKEECGDPVSFVSFKNDFDELDMAKLPKPLDDEHVLVELTYPEVEVDQLAYLDFKTFYEYISEKVHEMIDEDPSNKYLLPLLADVKKSLGV